MSSRSNVKSPRRPAPQLSRRDIKAQKAAARAGDVVAAERILAHSIALRHRRLSLRRYLLAYACGSTKLEAFRTYCEQIAAELSPGEVMHMARDIRRILERSCTKRSNREETAD